MADQEQHASFNGVVGSYTVLPRLRDMDEAQAIILQENNRYLNGEFSNVTVTAPCIAGEVCGYRTIRNAGGGRSTSRCSTCWQKQS